MREIWDIAVREDPEMIPIVIGGFLIALYYVFRCKYRGDLQGLFLMIIIVICACLAYEFVCTVIWAWPGTIGSQ